MRLLKKEHLALWFLAAVVILGFSGMPSVVTAQQQSAPREVLAYADMVLYGGQVLTVDDAFTIVEAVAIRDGKFLAIGGNQRIRAMAGPNTRQIDLRGKTVLPGIIDTHTHFHNRAERGLWANLVFQTRDQWLNLVKRQVDAAEPGEWVIFRTSRTVNQPFAQSVFAMTRRDLDPISPNNPVFVWTSPPGNDALVNNYALRLAEMPPDISGLTKDENGEPTGFLDMEAYGRMYYELIPWPSIDELLPLYRVAMRHFAAQGKTLMASRFPPYVITTLKRLWEDEDLTLRVRIIHEFARNSYRPEAIVKRVGNLSGLGDNWLKISAASVGNPGGSAGNGRGWTRNPKLPGTGHAPDPNQPDLGFVPYFEDHQGSDWKTIPILSRYGWRILGGHTAGDRSVDELLSAYEAAHQEKSIVDLHHGVDHSLMIRPEHIATMVRLGLVAGAEDNLGEARSTAGLAKALRGG